MQSKTPSGYVYHAVECETAAELEKELNLWKNSAGFYPYFLPQAKGCILAVATENPEAKKHREQKTVIAGLEPITENQLKEAILNNADFDISAVDTVERFIVKLYEQGYEVCKKTDKETVQ